MPRYKDIWKVSKVLRYHDSLGLNESLSFKKLTKKLGSVLARPFGVVLHNWVCLVHHLVSSRKLLV